MDSRVPDPLFAKVQTAVVAVGRPPLQWCSLLQPETRVQTDGGSVATDDRRWHGVGLQACRERGSGHGLVDLL